RTLRRGGGSHRRHRRVGGKDRHVDGVGGEGRGTRARRRTVATPLPEAARRAAAGAAVAPAPPGRRILTRRADSMHRTGWVPPGLVVERINRPGGRSSPIGGCGRGIPSRRIGTW